LLPKEEHRSPEASEVHYRLLKLLEAKPHLSQRALARELGISLGKINYCIAAVIEKGWVKAQNFRDSQNKLAYAYLLTPRGIEQKAALTTNFLRRKIAEYDSLKEEIAQLQREVRDRGLRARP
jgi:MarR family transcriptional regulator, temperature-dependent positive regulator of motility